MSSPFDTITLKLDGLRNSHSTQGKTIRAARAFCPCHQRPPHILGRGRTLSVAETLDGMLLLYCHSGCSVDEIICAAGFTINDLFPLVIPPASRGVGNGWYSIANAVDAIVDAARLLAAHAISNVSVDEICVAHLNLENKAQEFISIAHAALARGARK